ncbi:MAG: hypothetical protein KF770_00845 [Anaerolineae bacterium]|nr:hypothetical protein [Anaerolineae bacterium]
MSGIWQIIRDALSLDVTDLVYLYRPQNMDMTLLSQVGQPRPGVFVRIGAFFWRMLKLIRQLPQSGRMPPLTPQAPLFFVSTNNQTAALRPLAKEINGAYLLGIDGFGDHQLPLLPAYVWSLFFFPLALARYIRAWGVARRPFRYVFDMYWLAYGYYILVRRLLRRMRPAVVIMANDHMLWTRAMLRAAQAEKITTIYLQHASVSERFPPLAFDFALLDGFDAAQKYAACGPSATQVFLVGLPRFDAYAGQTNRRRQAAVAGICVNPQNGLAEVAALAETLVQNLPGLQFILRPHPGDTRRKMWQNLAQQVGWECSDGRTEPAFHFLSRMDVVLAGDSNILLEAALMNVYPIYYDFLGQKLDYYGFHRNGLAAYYDSPQAVVVALQELATCKPDVRERTKRYCASVHTAYDGRSAELAAALINQIIAGESLTGGDWQRAPEIEGVAVYELSGRWSC